MEFKNYETMAVFGRKPRKRSAEGVCRDPEKTDDVQVGLADTPSELDRGRHTASMPQV